MKLAALVDELLDAADALHERCAAEDRIVKSPQWETLGVLLDKWKPLGYWRNTGLPRIQDEPLPLEMP